MNFPTTYAPELGNIDCTVNGDKVPCEVDSPFTILVSGPSTQTGLDTEFELVVYGVRQTDGNAGQLYLGLSNGHSADVAMNSATVKD